MGGRGWAGWSGVKGRKWDNCNSIINKYIKKKTLVIRMLTELVEYGCKTEKKVKAMKSEIKGTNSEGKETRTQINSLEQKEEINIQSEQNEETRIQKCEERLRNLWDNFKYCNS